MRPTKKVGGSRVLLMDSADLREMALSFSDIHPSEAALGDRWEPPRRRVWPKYPP